MPYHNLTYYNTPYYLPHHAILIPHYNAVACERKDAGKAATAALSTEASQRARAVRTTASRRHRPRVDIADSNGDPKERSSRIWKNVKEYGDPKQRSSRRWQECNVVEGPR